MRKTEEKQLGIRQKNCLDLTLKGDAIEIKTNAIT